MALIIFIFLVAINNVTNGAVIEFIFVDNKLLDFLTSEQQMVNFLTSKQLLVD